MDDFDPILVARRSIKGIAAFVSRSIFIQSVNFGRDAILAALLTPAIYGVYFIVEGFVGILGYISDIGLGGALIQKKDPITDEELSTTFVVQEGIVLVIVVLVFLLSNQIRDFYHFPQEAIFLLQAFVIAFFISTLKTIPSILMERNLQYDKFVIPQVVETICYTVVLVGLAYKGFGINSFSIAVLVRAVSGLIAMYIIFPWTIKPGFSIKALRHLLSYGVPFQTNSILALIKDNLFTSVFLGKVLPDYQLGYISFAQKWTYVPLRIVTDNITRITFSSFARLQHDKKALGAALEKSLFASTALVFPGVVGLVLIVPYIIAIIPKYHKWEPALLAFIFFGMNILLAAMLIPITNLLNAIGKIKITLYFMVGWTVFIWIATPIGIHLYGFNAFPAITAIINVSVIPLILIAKRYVDFNIVSAIKSPLLSTIIMGVVLYILNPLVIHNIYLLVLMIACGGLVYLGTLFLFSKNQIIADIKFIKENLKK